MPNIFQFLSNFKDKCDSFIQRKCPTLSNALYISTTKYNFSRSLLGLCYGIVISFLFWENVIWNLKLGIDLTYHCLYVLLIVLGFGCAFSTRIRCICFLATIGFFGKAGRSYLKALVFTFIIAGPINNLSQNGKEVVRVFTCSMKLTYNLTKTRFDLMAKPFHNALFSMRNNVSHMKDKFADVENVLAPIVQEVELPDDAQTTLPIVRNIRRTIKQSVNVVNGDTIDPKDSSASDAEFYLQLYKEKIITRCKLQIRKGAEKCRAAFVDAYNRCIEKLPMIVEHVLCWPMKITFVCNIGEALGVGENDRGICDPSDKIDIAFGGDYAELINTEQQLLANFSNVKLNYTYHSARNDDGFRTAKETSKRVMHEFNQKMTLFDYCMTIIRRILSLIFIKVIKDTIVYQYKYLNNINHDNVYITEYFKTIDLRRSRRSASTLLPLKKLEKSELIDPTSYRRFRKEYWKMLGHVTKILLEITVASCFLLLDHLISVGLELVAKHAQIDYEQTGEHIVNITVNGTGIIADLIRTSIDGFNVQENIRIFSTNKPCLPRKNRLSQWFYLKIYGTYLIILLLIYNEIYIHRTRRMIIAYFYPKREKKRILYLYNNQLKRRRGLFKIMSKEVAKNLKEGSFSTHENYFIRLRMAHPKTFNWLKIFPIARRKCIICKELEPWHTDRNCPYHFTDCTIPLCNIVYCDYCWYEIGQICLGHHNIYQVNFRDNLYSDYTTVNE